MGAYPTGPPTCGGPLDPSCRVLVPDMSRGGPLAVFSFWILVFIACSIFQLYKACYLRKQPVWSVVKGGNTDNQKIFDKNDNHQNNVHSTDKSSVQMVIDVEITEEPLLQFTGYRTVFFGEVCWCLCILMSLQWIAIYLMVLLDTYDKCQVTGIDNLCFYGTYFIFGSYNRNGTVSMLGNLPILLWVW